MSNSNPYRAVGTFAGPSYVKRSADDALLRAIDENSRYPYILSPRQTGKSSLIVTTIRKIEELKLPLKCVFVDLSKFPKDSIKSYNALVKHFTKLACKELGIPNYDKGEPDLQDSFSYMINSSVDRIVLFIDEVDVLQQSEFRDEFFSLIRAMFNERAWRPSFNNLQVVLSGAAPPSRLIKDPNRSPFNVGLKIRLDDLTVDQVDLMVRHLSSLPVEIDENLPKILHHQTSGSVYLTQLILERTWQQYTHSASPMNRINQSVIEQIVDTIIKMEALEDPHFRKMYDSLHEEPRLLHAFSDLANGKKIDGALHEALLIIGILGNEFVFRNRIYRRVFGPDGSLPLFSTSDLPSKSPDITIKAVDGIPELAQGTMVVRPAPFRPEERTDIFIAREANVQSSLVVPRIENWPPTIVGPSTDSISAQISGTRTAHIGTEVITASPESKTAVQPRTEVQQPGPLVASAIPSATLAGTAIERRLDDSLIPIKDSPLQSGIALGNYKVVRLIGSGGMSSVFEAVHAVTGLKVAIKVLAPNLAQNTALGERMLAEAHAISLLNHPGIVQMIDYNTYRGSPYIVMEYLEGDPLSKIISTYALQGKKMPLTEAVDYIYQIARVLTFTHSKEIIHRDIKPSNVIISQDELLTSSRRAKLLDFGIARVRSERYSGNQTDENMIMGTLRYMSPEQTRGTSSVTDKSDVYSLGAIFYELLTGSPPFTDGDFVSIATSKFLQIPISVTTVRPDIPENIGNLIATMLAVLPSVRPTAEDVAERLKPFLDHPNTSAGALIAENRDWSLYPLIRATVIGFSLLCLTALLYVLYLRKWP